MQKRDQDEAWSGSTSEELTIRGAPKRASPDSSTAPSIPIILPSAPSPVAQFPYRVLLVDDEPAIRAVVKSSLENQGYEVRTAEDGIAGLLALTKSWPDVIISDLQMPRMAGVEFLSVVRQRFPRIAIIAMSGNYVPGEGLTVIMADAFWQKGQGVKKLLQEISRVVEASPARSAREKIDVEPAHVRRDNGGCLLVACPMCLRLNKLQASNMNGGIHESVCPSCGTPAKFEINHEILR